MNDRPMHSTNVWWLNPAVLLGMFGTLIISGAMAIPAENYHIYYRVTKYIQLNNVVYALMPLLSFILGCLLAMMLWKSLRKNTAFYSNFDRQAGFYRKVIFALFGITLLGYMLWGLMLVQNGATPATFIAVLTGEQGAIFDIKHKFMTKVSGVTSLTNFCVPFMVLAVYYTYLYKDKTIKKMIVVIFLLAVFRAIFFSERLAILELLVPGMVIYVVMRLREGKKIRFISTFPLIGFLFVITLFGIGEYFRSWINYYVNVYPSYFDFITTRFMGYYVNALNTGMLYLQELGAGSNPFPFFTLEWLWKFPLMDSVYTGTWYVNPEDTVKNVLYTMGNPEYNNPSGMMLPYQDYGIIGTGTFFLLLGIITGSIYTLFQKGYMFGAFLYPIWFLGLTELPRYIYFTSGRFFPAWLSFFAILVMVAIRIRLSMNPNKQLLPRNGEKPNYENYNHERLHMVQQR
ncbi:O-antigen polymerase [Paenibacillus swuensis]|uniref:O-antigen polymerase n=1 Tax=Paenibacillus swuensis TaxID=1178515 RepID=UPI0008383D92|nr:O-antigen polymerase [Paenibacillus swuensis]